MLKISEYFLIKLAYLFFELYQCILFSSSEFNIPYLAISLDIKTSKSYLLNIFSVINFILNEKSPLLLEFVCNSSKDFTNLGLLFSTITYFNNF